MEPFTVFDCDHLITVPQPKHVHGLEDTTVSNDSLDSPAPSTVNDSPPPYECSISLSSANCWLKHEKSDPSQPAPNRSWRQVRLELRGTMLLLHGTHPAWRAQLSSYLANRSIYAKAEVTETVQRYTLQGGQVGLASDYYKSPNCIRIRAEGEQLLLCAPSSAARIEWVEKLNAAIDISLSIDNRGMPCERTMPLGHMSRPLLLALRDIGGRADGTQGNGTGSPDAASSSSRMTSDSSVLDGAAVPIALWVLTMKAGGTEDPDDDHKWHPMHCQWSSALELEYRTSCLDSLKFAAKWPYKWIVRDGHFVRFNQKTSRFDVLEKETGRMTDR